MPTSTKIALTLYLIWVAALFVRAVFEVMHVRVVGIDRLWGYSEAAIFLVLGLFLGGALTYELINLAIKGMPANHNGVGGFRAANIMLWTILFSFLAVSKYFKYRKARAFQREMQRNV